MNGSAVPENYDGTAQMAEEMANKTTDFLAAYVPEVKLVIKTQAPALRTDRDSGNSRNSVVTIQVTENRRVPPWSPGLVDTGDQQKARFVDKDEVGSQPAGVFFTRGQSLRFQRSSRRSSRSSARRSGF